MEADLPTNHDRANWARAALKAFGEQTRQNEPEYETQQELIAEIVGDLIADLFHVLREAELDPVAILDNAWGNFQEEVAEEEEDTRDS